MKLGGEWVLSGDLLLVIVLISQIGNAVDKAFCSRSVGPFEEDLHVSRGELC